MAALLRFFTILRCLLRYRLDTLLPREHLGWPLRLLCTLTALLPEPTLSRGERLRRFCEDLGPVFIKFGQLLSTRPDLLPPDLINELDQLQDNVPPFDPEQSRQLIETALEAPVAELFASFDSQPLASASVAQVHAAVLPDGREVVVKVVRPGLEKIISNDIALMNLLARLLEQFSEDGRRLRLIEVVADYRHVIFDELDLQREAANASQLRRNFAGSPLLYIPDVYWQYCRSNVMVMERIYGIPVTRIDQLNAQHTDMKLLAERGVEIFFTQVFKHNFFHADMHPGNIFVSHQHPERPQYIAVDMAIVGSLTQADQYYLARNLLAMFRRDYRLVAELHIQSGWVPKTTPLNDFEAAIRTVCEPIFEKPLKEISFGQILIKLFQTARRFDMQVQPQLILLQKTLLNIEGLGRQLYPDLDLWATAHPFLENWVRDRFHPKALLQQLKRYGPEWMEQFPLVPQALFNALKQADNLSKIAPELHSAAEHFANQREQAPRRRLLSLTALAAATATVISAWPALGQQLANLPPLSWGLAAIATAAWLLR